MKNLFVKRTLSIVTAAALVLSAGTVPSFAYIERGDVIITGDSSYSMDIGETAAISISPYAEEHYPGCGMPECPESCEDKIIDRDGEESSCIVYVNGQPECVCAGRTMVMYNADVQVSSSDSSVAEAAYDGNGTVTISAKASGNAEISIEAAFREYNTANKTVSVNVKSEMEDNNDENTGGSGDNSSSDENTGGNSSNSSGGSSDNGNDSYGGGGSSDGTTSGGSSSSSGGGGSSGGGSGSNVSDNSDIDQPDDKTSADDGQAEDPSDENKNDAQDNNKTDVKYPVIDPIITPTVNFIDVSGWAEEYIMYLAQRGIVNGKTESSFAPNDMITRAEFVKILAGVAGADIITVSVSPFSDVAAGAWYAPYVAWASANGIVQGGNNGFSPNSNISRQDMAVMISRYVNTVSVNKLTPVNARITFDDNAEISSYAADAVAEMQQAGIIDGNGNNCFAPKDYATRAAACKMLAMVMQKTV